MLDIPLRNTKKWRSFQSFLY